MDRHVHLGLKRKLRRRRPTGLRISTQMPIASLENRVLLKATQMYAYLQDEIARIKAGSSPELFPMGIIADDFDTVHRAVAKIRMQPYDVSINSLVPPVYFFGTPKDDGDTEVTTKLLFNLFEKEGISRSIFFHDNGQMPHQGGRYTSMNEFPTRRARIYMWGFREKYNSIIGPDKARAFASLHPDDKWDMMRKIEEFSRDWASIEKSIVGYLAQEPEERCFEYVKDLVKYIICKDRVSIEKEKEIIEKLRGILDETIDAPASLVDKVHNLAVPLVGPSVPVDNLRSYRQVMLRLPAKIRELRDRRFAYVMQLHEAISPDMERFKAKVPTKDWVKHKSALPNLAGLLREAGINYVIFVPRPDAVYKFPDSVLNTL